MSTPVQQTPTRPSVATATSARQRRQGAGNRTGSPSGRSAEQAFLQFQSTAGNRAATAAVQRVRNATVERPRESAESSRPGTPDTFVTARPGTPDTHETSRPGTPDTFVTARPGTPDSHDTSRPGTPDTFVTAREPEADGTEADGTETDARAREELLKKATELLERFKRNLEPTDNLAKGAQSPTSAGLGQTATASGDGALKHDAAASGTSGASWNLLTELTGVVVNSLDALKNLKASRKNRTGAAHHTARKKSKTKGADAVVGTASTGGYGAAVAKDAVKLQAVADTATAAEVSGVFSAVTGLWKGARAAGRVGGATRKYRRVKNLGEAGAVHAELLARLQGEVGAAVQRVDELTANLEAVVEANRGRRPALWYPAATAAADALGAAYIRASDAHAAHQRAELDVETLGQTQKYAKKKQLTKIGKETVGGVLGEPAKAAGGIVATVAAAGALGSNPAGWITAAVGAGLILGVAGYKGGRAAKKRFEEAHHPERYTPEGEEAVAAKSGWESLKHSLKVWKKVSRHERRLMAHKIYRMAAGPDVPGSAETTPEVRQSARELLVALKAGPDQHRMERAAWEASLNDPEHRGAWLKEIAEQLASG
ncbi:hypothetical protein ACIQFU_02100 [Streptomyces sp. NPDC093065]|uniref:hypothetical protein n=1 Tax=Streptomyces sp. NPDC093065 TaxID=3366021 RepID=UPI0037FFFBE1